MSLLVSKLGSLKKIIYPLEKMHGNTQGGVRFYFVGRERGLEVIGEIYVWYFCQHSEQHYSSPKARQGIALPKMLLDSLPWRWWNEGETRKLWGSCRRKNGSNINKIMPHDVVKKRVFLWLNACVTYMFYNS